MKNNNISYTGEYTLVNGITPIKPDRPPYEWRVTKGKKVFVSLVKDSQLPKGLKESYTLNKYVDGLPLALEYASQKADLGQTLTAEEAKFGLLTKIANSQADTICFVVAKKEFNHKKLNTVINWLIRGVNVTLVLLDVKTGEFKTYEFVAVTNLKLNPVYQAFSEEYSNKIGELRQDAFFEAWTVSREVVIELVKELGYNVDKNEERIEELVKGRQVKHINAVLAKYDSFYRIPQEGYVTKGTLTKSMIESMKIEVSTWSGPLGIPVLVDGLTHYSSTMYQSSRYNRYSDREYLYDLVGSDRATAAALKNQKDLYKVKERLADVIDVYYQIQQYKKLVADGLLTYEDLLLEGYHMCECDNPIADSYYSCPHCCRLNPNYKNILVGKYYDSSCNYDFEEDFEDKTRDDDFDDDDMDIQTDKYTMEDTSYGNMDESMDYEIEDSDDYVATSKNVVVGYSDCYHEYIAKYGEKVVFNNDCKTTFGTYKAASVSNPFYVRPGLRHENKSLLKESVIEKEKLPTLRECATWDREIKDKEKELEAKRKAYVERIRG